MHGFYHYNVDIFVIIPNKVALKRYQKFLRNNYSSNGQFLDRSCHTINNGKCIIEITDSSVGCKRRRRGYLFIVKKCIFLLCLILDPFVVPHNDLCIWTPHMEIAPTSPKVFLSCITTIKGVISSICSLAWSWYLLSSFSFWMIYICPWAHY